MAPSVLWAALLWMLSPATVHSQATDLELTEQEARWLADHPIIRVHNEMDWPPFNFNADGKPMGFSIDFMDLLAEKAGIEVEYVWGPSWDEFMGMMRNAELDCFLGCR